MSEFFEQCFDCMHSIVRYGNFVCQCPAIKKDNPTMLSRVVRPEFSCPHWDTEDENYPVSERTDFERPVVYDS